MRFGKELKWIMLRGIFSFFIGRQKCVRLMTNVEERKENMGRYVNPLYMCAGRVCASVKSIHHKKSMFNRQVKSM